MKVLDLQSIMMTLLLIAFEEWIIVIFDNILILAYDYQKAYDKFDKFVLSAISP
jgi:hypothetical protein